MTTLVTTSYFQHFGEASYPHHFKDYLQLSLVLWPPPNLIILVISLYSISPTLIPKETTFHSNPSYDHLHWWPPFTPKKLWWLYPTLSIYSTSYRNCPHPFLHLIILLYTQLLSPKYVSSHTFNQFFTKFYSYLYQEVYSYQGSFTTIINITTTTTSLPPHSNHSLQPMEKPYNYFSFPSE